MSYTPPNTDAYEVSLMRSAMEPRYAHQIFTSAIPAHFGNEAMRTVFAKARAIHFAGEELSFDSLKYALECDGIAPEVVGDWLAPVIAAEAKSGGEYVVRLLASSRQKQLVHDLGVKLTSQQTSTKTPAEVMAEINEFSIAQHSLTTASFESLDAVATRILNRKESPVVLVPEMGPLDNLMRIRRGSFTIIAADSGGGKTAMMVNMMVNLAKRGIPSACASIEMKNDELAILAIAMLSGVDAGRMEDGLLSPNEQEHVAHIITQSKEVLSLIHVMDPSTFDVDAVASVLNDAIVQYNVGAFFLDYIQKCTAKGPLVKTTTDRVQYVSERLTADAKRTGIPIIGLSQFSRADGRKGMANLKNSSQLEHDAHSIFVLRQLGEDNDGIRMLECEAVKNRKGIKGTELLKFHLPCQRIEHSGVHWKDVKQMKKADTTAPF